MEFYIFNLTTNEKEALMSALSEDVYLNHGDAFIGARIRKQLASSSSQVQIEGGQLGPILKALEAAIERQEMDSGDWVRAREYREAKGILIAKTRLQFRVMQGGIS